MIASKIGKTFLKAYNRKYDTEYSAKEFFIKVFWEIIFNHPLYLMSGGNSPIENPKISWKKGDRPSLENRKERLKKMIEKIESESADASTVIGFPASIEKEFGATSGNVTDIDFKTSYDDKYLSWVGGALGIGIDNGFTILFNNPEILLATFEGWSMYREFLNDKSIEKLSGNKINSWNGQWLNFYYSEDTNFQIDFSFLDEEGFFVEGKGLDKGFIVINTVIWSRLFFSLSKKLSHKTLTGYIYKPFYKGDTTIGFIPFKFDEANSLSNTYKKLFGDFDAMEQQKDYEVLMGKSIREACKLGSIGIQALEPKGLTEYFKDKSKNLKFTKSTKVKKNESEEDFVFRDRKIKKKQYGELITFRTYKIWLITMITKNKEEVLDYTSEIAKKLSEFHASDKKGSTKHSNLLNELFESNTKKKFLLNLTEILKNEKDDKKDYLKELRDRIHLMNSEDFGYFVTLLKFDYAYQQKEN